MLSCNRMISQLLTLSVLLVSRSSSSSAKVMCHMSSKWKLISTRKGRKPARICDKCGETNHNIYPTCNPCRTKGCLHEHWHYSSTYAKTCNQCGSTVAKAVRRKGRNTVGTGEERKAPWQHDNGLPFSAQEEPANAVGE